MAAFKLKKSDKSGDMIIVMENLMENPSAVSLTAQYGGAILVHSLKHRSYILKI